MIYKGREHFSTPLRNEWADKFLFIKHNFGETVIYPKRLFKEV